VTQFAKPSKGIKMLEFFQGLDAVQWVLLVGGVLLLAPTAYGYLATDDDEEKDDKKDVKEDLDDLTGLVYKWEQFHDSCHEAGLDEACEKLFEMFPLLIKSYDHKTKNN